MFLTGYHGTSLEKGNKIIEEERFIESSGDREWLGNGIYFYFSFADAYSWRDSEVVLHSIIKIKDEEYLDIDTPEGEKLYNAIVNAISVSQAKAVLPNANAQQNQCAVMKMLWNLLPQLKVISASFATQPTKYKTLIDKRPRRKEFCVRNNDCIKHSYMIRRADIND